jgi:hypothetical protein
MAARLPEMRGADVSEIIKAHRRTREQFIAEGRKAFRPGRRQPCHICDKFRYIAQAHHVVPLGEQFDRGFERPDQERVWLCPNHHTMIHVLIDGRPTDQERGRRAVPVLGDLDKEQTEKVMGLIARSGRGPA